MKSNLSKMVLHILFAPPIHSYFWCFVWNVYFLYSSCTISKVCDIFIGFSFNILCSSMIIVVVVVVDDFFLYLIFSIKFWHMFTQVSSQSAWDASYFPRNIQIWFVCVVCTNIHIVFIIASGKNKNCTATSNTVWQLNAFNRNILHCKYNFECF